MPRVSAIVLSHREDAEGLRFLGDAIDSVTRQTYRDFEIVVKHATAWWPEKMNEAVRGTSGELYFFLCYDDMIAPTWLAECVAALDRAHADIAYTDNRIFGVGAPTIELGMPPFSRQSLTNWCVPHFTALTKRAVWEDIGYDGAQFHVDWDFWASACERGKIGVHVAEPLFLNRVHGGNSSRQDGVAKMADLRAKHPWIAEAGNLLTAH